MKKGTIGSGLTARAEVTYSWNEWTKALASSFLGREWPTYAEGLVAWKRWAQQILSAAGRPTDDLAVVVATDGSWSYVNDAAAYLRDHDEPARIIPGLDYSNGEEEESLAWYAAQILRRANAELILLRPDKTRPTSHSKARARSAEERRLRELASRANAYQLGLLIERVRWKFRHEKAALFGHAHAAATVAWRSAGTAAQKAKGEETTALLRPNFEAVLARERSPSRLTDSVILYRMQKLNPNLARRSRSTMLRHVKKLMQERRGAPK